MSNTRTPKEIKRQDRWQDVSGGTTHTEKSWGSLTPVRVLPWPKPGVDGVPEEAPDPPRMDEVWPGREMRWKRGEQKLRLEGSRPAYDVATEIWVVPAISEGNYIGYVAWDSIKPIDPPVKEAGE